MMILGDNAKNLDPIKEIERSAKWTWRYILDNVPVPGWSERECHVNFQLRSGHDGSYCKDSTTRYNLTGRLRRIYSELQ